MHNVGRDGAIEDVNHGRIRVNDKRYEQCIIVTKSLGFSRLIEHMRLFVDGNNKRRKIALIESQFKIFCTVVTKPTRTWDLSAMRLYSLN